MNRHVYYLCLRVWLPSVRQEKKIHVSRENNRRELTS